MQSFLNNKIQEAQSDLKNQFTKSVKRCIIPEVSQ